MRYDLMGISRKFEPGLKLGRILKIWKTQNSKLQVEFYFGTTPNLLTSNPQCQPPLVPLNPQQLSPGSCPRRRFVPSRNDIHSGPAVAEEAAEGDSCNSDVDGSAETTDEAGWSKAIASSAESTVTEPGPEAREATAGAAAGRTREAGQRNTRYLSVKGLARHDSTGRPRQAEESQEDET